VIVPEGAADLIGGSFFVQSACDATRWPAFLNFWLQPGF
jgi:hypothetical protein